MSIGKALLPFGALLAMLAMGCVARVDAEPETTAAPETREQSAALCGGGSFEGCFRYADMPAFLQAADEMVAPFFLEAYPGAPNLRDVVLISGRGGRSVCGTHTLDSYEYCPGNDTIYIGQDLLWGFYRLGDAAPVVGLAHEYGHHLQTYLRLPLPRTARESVRYENQADCISGAWAKYASDKGWLEETDDLRDIEGLMQAIGSRESSYRDHGTTTERVTAFNTGYKSGLEACTA